MREKVRKRRQHCHVKRSEKARCGLTTLQVDRNRTFIMKTYTSNGSPSTSCTDSSRHSSIGPCRSSGRKRSVLDTGWLFCQRLLCTTRCELFIEKVQGRKGMYIPNQAAVSEYCQVMCQGLDSAAVSRFVSRLVYVPRLDLFFLALRWWP